MALHLSKKIKNSLIFLDFRFHLQREREKDGEKRSRFFPEMTGCGGPPKYGENGGRGRKIKERTAISAMGRGFGRAPEKVSFFGDLTLMWSVNGQI